MKADKRILSLILVFLLCISAVPFAVSAEDVADAPDEQMYKDIVFDTLGDRVKDSYYYRFEYAYNEDGSTPDEGEVPDYILAFISAESVHDEVIEKVIGDYYFSSSCSYYPFELGYFICTPKYNWCYSLEEAKAVKLPYIDEILAKLGTPIEEVDNYLTRYRKEIISLLDWTPEMTDYVHYECLLEFNADGSTPDEGNADYVLAFAHTGGVLEWDVYETIGNYKMRSPAVYNPGDLIYSVRENKIYSIREAWNMGIPNMDNVLELLGNKVTLYADEFEKFLEPYKDPNEENSVFGWYGYDELYYYHNEAGGTTEMPEATPDYVLIDACAYHCPPANVTEVFGDYVVYSGWGNPEALRYFVYTPESGNIYTLRQAYDMELEGIMNVFTDYGLGFLLGDMDNDQKLTIKDATYIQKYLAKFEGYTCKGEDTTIPDWVHIDIADFDLNSKINVKDATAIQKRLANITE